MRRAYSSIHFSSPLLLILQLHGNVKEEIEALRFEEASIRRRYTLQGGVAVVRGRLATEEGANLEQLQRTRLALGKGSSNVLALLYEVVLYRATYALIAMGTQLPLPPLLPLPGCHDDGGSGFGGCQHSLPHHQPIRPANSTGQ